MTTIFLSLSLLINLQSNNSNLGSLEIRASTYISAKLKKRTYMYDSLQFPVEMNTRGVTVHTAGRIQEHADEDVNSNNSL